MQGVPANTERRPPPARQAQRVCLDYWNSVVSRELKFEWREANLQAHGVSFDLAKTVFEDPFAIERLDDREDYGEERFVIIGVAKGHIMLHVAYAERDQRICISARIATHNRLPRPTSSG
jgi:uncharacterized DUF497 family protein